MLMNEICVFFARYLEEEQGAVAIRDVERIHIVSFMAYAKLEGKSPRTIARYIASLRSFFSFFTA
ncbi:integrase/recombinase XerD [Listeria cornellensis FSL F6-0969]|uniref:Integrase/recombinase XerD n=1 Tax=Listeria cornellensis FSL F6-0969 TaxID=1265820 RepID=W7C1C0_9LIST|nr:integrase/recombinase XerD [Listeria cornellensis FSL F6-0969]